MLCMCHRTCMLVWTQHGSQFSTSVIWVLGIKLRLSSLAASAFILWANCSALFILVLILSFLTHTQTVQWHHVCMAVPPSPSPDSNDLWPLSVNDSQFLSCPVGRALFPVCDIGYSRKFLTERGMHNICLHFLSFFLLFLSFSFCAG